MARFMEMLLLRVPKDRRHPTRCPVGASKLCRAELEQGFRVQEAGSANVTYRTLALLLPEFPMPA